MHGVSLFRLYLLRATYVFVVLGLAATVWPPVLNHTAAWPLMNGVVCCLLAAVSVLAALGIRYPLQLLPILFFELVWKSIWLAAVALPLWIGGQMDEQSMSTVIDCLVGVILMPLAIPWGFVVSSYVKRPGDRWRRVAPSQVESTESAVIGNPTGIRQ